MQVALTFDAEISDGPDGDVALQRILDALGNGGIRASFFLQGRWVEARPALAGAIA